MNLSNDRRPTEKDAIEIALGLIGEMPVSVRRFTTGTGHWVYEILSADSSVRVVRIGMAKQRNDFLGAIHWSKTLRQLGIPLPELLAQGEHRGLPYIVLERLKGQDLGQVYSALSSTERKAIAEQVCQIQSLVGTLPRGDQYGFIRLPGGPGHRSWEDVILASLARSRERISKAGLVSLGPLDRVSEQVSRFSDYFAQVRAIPFLDDMTTKNVLVHEGRFSGIVDVDWVCYGDSLFTLALTRTAILSAGAHPDYTEHWCKLLGLTKAQQAAVNFYTALFCVDFMSEFGQVFNQDLEMLDLERLERLEHILSDQLENS